MIGIENLAAFIITALLFIMAPGIDTVFILNKSVGQGRESGIYATIGINSGVLMHTLFAAMGLSVIIAKSALAFMLVKYVGAAYLIYLGLSRLKNKEDLANTDRENQPKTSVGNDFWSGFITNTLNPKVALFFLAFFPQFINPEQIHKPVPFIFLGFTYALIGMIWYTFLTIFASTFSKNLKQNPKAGLWIGKISGLVFLGMGIKIALSQN